MRQEHKAGERLFLDWAGDTIPLIDPATGEIRPCYLFVAVLGASNYTYAEPSLSQDLAAFLGAHVRMFEFLGGVPELLVPRQPEDRSHQGLPLRTRSQPRLHRPRRALRLRVLPTRPPAPGQGQSRSRRSLSPSAASSPACESARSSVCRGPVGRGRAGARSKRASLPETARLAHERLSRRRTSGASAPARPSL